MKARLFATLLGAFVRTDRSGGFLAAHGEERTAAEGEFLFRIGDARYPFSATAEELGLRVDVLSPKPDVATLVEALAEFAAARRAQGDPPPSASRKKKATRR